MKRKDTKVGLALNELRTIIQLNFLELRRGDLKSFMDRDHKDITIYEHDEEDGLTEHA